MLGQFPIFEVVIAATLLVGVAVFLWSTILLSRQTSALLASLQAPEHRWKSRVVKLGAGISTDLTGEDMGEVEDGDAISEEEEMREAASLREVANDLTDRLLGGQKRG